MANRREEKRLARIAQHEVVIVIAHACGQCSKVYRSEADARECCTCDTCGSKFDTRSKNSVSGHAYTCGHCQYPEIVRYAKEAVEREKVRLRSAEGDLASAEKRLADLLATPRPEKGAPQHDW